MSSAKCQSCFVALPFCLLAFGCGAEGEEAEPPADVKADTAERIGTVVRVTWSTRNASVGYVEYGPTKELGSVTPIEARETTAHEATLLGLTADTRFYYRVVTWKEHGSRGSELHTVQTAPLPNSMPEFTVTGSGHDAYTIVPVLGATPAILILDPRGNIVWYRSEPRPLDFFRARLSVDGKSLLYNAATVAGDPEADTEIVRVSLDGSKASGISIPLLAHDFVEHPDGTLAAIVTEYRDFHGEQLRGNAIVEITPDGEQKVAFSVWDCFDPERVTGDAIDQGWTFAEALDFDPKENVYYLGLRNFSSIVKIERSSGSCEWVLGLYGNTFDFAAGSTHFLHQHQFELTGDRILVLDNDGSAGAESRVLQYQLDFAKKRAKETWKYVADPPVYTFALGEPTQLEDGDVLVNWSLAGQMDRVSPEGELRWRINTQAGFAFGFHTLARSLYPTDARFP